MHQNKTPIITHILATPTPEIKHMGTPTPLAVPTVLPNEQGIKVPVLLYHFVSINPNKTDTLRTGLSTIPSIFEKQLELLSSNGFTTISFDDMAAAFAGKAALPSKPVILTFDDGYTDFYFNAVPILKKYNMKGVSFIPTGLIGSGIYMTWSQIEDLSTSSNVIFEAHSVHHYYLPKSSPAVLVKEIVDSKKILEQHVGYTVNWFCYPYGGFNDAVVAAVRNAGYVGSATTLPGAWQYQSRLFYIPRYRAGNRLGNDLLKLVL